MENAIVIEPHDDDMVIGMGGTALKILETDIDLTSIQMTDGRHGHNQISPKKLIDKRKKEKEISNSYLEEVSGGSLNWEYIGAEDGRLMDFWENHESREQLVSEIEESLEPYNPDAVFVPALNEDHPDHVASNLLCSEAIDRLDSDPAVFNYMVWQLPFHESDPGDIENILAIDVSEDYEKKINAVKLHQTQDYPESFKEIETGYDIESQLQESPGEFSGYIDHRDGMNSYIFGQLLGARPGERTEIIGSPETENTIDQVLDFDYESVGEVSHGREGSDISPET